MKEKIDAVLILLADIAKDEALHPTAQITVKMAISYLSTAATVQRQVEGG